MRRSANAKRSKGLPKKFQNTKRDKFIRGKRAKEHQIPPRALQDKSHNQIPVEQFVKYPDLRETAAQLEMLAERDSTDIYMDASCFDMKDVTSGPDDQLFRRYCSLIKIHKDRMYNQVVQRLISDIKFLSEFYENFLARENVFLTNGVIGEVNTFLNTFLKKSEVGRGSKKEKRRYTSPILRIQKSIGRAREKIEDSGIEENPLAERLYKLIPGKILRGDVLTEEPSETDKWLLTYSLARGFLTARNQIIMTNDRGISKGLKFLNIYLMNHPESLEIKDLNIKVSEFSGETRMIKRINGNPVLAFLERFDGRPIAIKLNQSNSSPSSHYLRPASEYSSAQN